MTIENQHLTDSELSAELLTYAKTLVDILPTGSARLRLAAVLAASGEIDQALSVLNEIETDDLAGREVFLAKAQILMDESKPKDAALVLQKALAKAKEDLRLSILCGKAWAIAREYDAAIRVLEPVLQSHANSTELNILLGQVYLQKASRDPAAASLAFDLFKKAFELSPTEPSLPAQLLLSGQSSGRSKEAWQIIGHLDLHANPYLRSEPSEKAIQLYVNSMQNVARWDSFYRAGLIPFAALREQLPRPSWFWWWARMAVFQRNWEHDRQSQSILIDLPSVVDAYEHSPTFGAGILIDVTALLTIGTLSATREISTALAAADVPLYLFPGCRDWLNREISRLEADQLPSYRQRHTDVFSLLQAGREKVVIQDRVQTAEPGEATKHFGPRGLDTSTAVAVNGYYLDDYVEAEKGETLPFLISSSDLLSTFVKVGLLLPDEAKQATEEHPEPFRKSTEPKYIDLSKPIVVSEPAILAWYGTGFLRRWIEGDVRWPKLVIGPYAWSQLDSNQFEATLYQEALDKCLKAAEVVEELIVEGKATELQAKTPPPLQGGPVYDLWKSALEILQLAKEHQLAVWADDLFMHLILDRRGLLSAEKEFEEAARAVRANHGRIRVLSTEGVLEALAEKGVLEKDRAGQLCWLLFSHGYRGLQLGLALRWWLNQIGYSSQQIAVPYSRLVNDFAKFPTYLPEGLPPDRLAVFSTTAMVSLGSSLIAELWTAHANAISSADAEIFAEMLAAEIQNALNATGPSELSLYFWPSLCGQLVSRSMDFQRRLESLRWLGRAVSKEPVTSRRVDIVRALEDLVLDSLDIFEKNVPKKAARHSLMRFMIPLSETPLVNDMNPDMRRFLGHILKLKNLGMGSVLMNVKKPNEPEFTIELQESEQEAAALETLRRARSDSELQVGEEVGGSYVKTNVEKKDPQGNNLPIPFTVSLMRLLLVAEPDLQAAIFKHMYPYLRVADPKLAQQLTNLFNHQFGKSRSKLMDRIARAYISSNYFHLKRDLAHALRRLSKKPLSEFDAFCGWTAATTNDRRIEQPSESTISAIRILMLREDQVAETASQIRQLLASLKSDPTAQTNRLQFLISNAESAANCFEGLWYFLVLLLGRNEFDGVAEFDLASWIRSFIAGMTRVALLAPERRDASDIVELRRRSIHAHMLRLSVWVSASRAHVVELNAHSQDSDEIIAAWLSRSFFLCDRLLPIMWTEPEWQKANIDSESVRINDRLKVQVNPEFYPDVFDPFIYGPDRYDPSTVTILSILRDTWRFLSPESKAKPFWWSEEIQQILIDIGAREVNEWEAVVVKDRNQGKPNRLRLILSQTPQEIAHELLVLAGE